MSIKYKKLHAVYLKLYSYNYETANIKMFINKIEIHADDAVQR